MLYGMAHRRREKADQKEVQPGHLAEA